jgi:WD40 repeat protein
LKAAGDALAFSPDGKVLAVATGFASGEREVTLWDVPGKKLMMRLPVVSGSKFRVVQGPDDHEDCQASGVAFSPDGKLLAVQRSWPGSVVLWDWKQKRELIWMNPAYEHLSALEFLPDGHTVAVAGVSMDGPPLLLWDVSEVTKKK